MNPSPGSGGFGDAQRGRAPPTEIRRYLNKISGPLLDRIDIHVEVPAVKHETLLRPHVAESSAEIRARVLKARQIQHARFASKRKVRCNAQMGSKDIKAFVPLDADGENLLRMALSELNLSARAYDRILKVVAHHRRPRRRGKSRRLASERSDPVPHTGPGRFWG